MGGGSFYGHSWEQGQPVFVQVCLEGFHRRCIDYLDRQFIPKWDSMNAESVLAMTGIKSLSQRFHVALCGLDG